MSNKQIFSEVATVLLGHQDVFTMDEIQGIMNDFLVSLHTVQTYRKLKLSSTNNTLEGPLATTPLSS